MKNGSSSMRMHNITCADDLAVFEPKDAENMIKLWNQDVNNVSMKLGMGIQKKVSSGQQIVANVIFQSMHPTGLKMN
jgi:predicted cupin superfamily sugar epimerase